MNKSYTGMVMTLPVVVNETFDRVLPAETKQGRTVVNHVMTLVGAMDALGRALTTPTPHVKIFDWDRNHTEYTNQRGAKIAVLQAINDLLGHTMVIGEMATVLLQQIEGYVNTFEKREDESPDEFSLEVARLTKEYVYSKINRRTTD